MAEVLRKGRKIRLNVEGDLRALAYLQSQAIQWRKEYTETCIPDEGDASRIKQHTALERALPVCLFAEEMQ